MTSILRKSASAVEMVFGLVICAGAELASGAARALQQAFAPEPRPEPCPERSRVRRG